MVGRGGLETIYRGKSCQCMLCEEAGKTVVFEKVSIGRTHVINVHRVGKHGARTHLKPITKKDFRMMKGEK